MASSMKNIRFQCADDDPRSPTAVLRAGLPLGEAVPAPPIPEEALGRDFEPPEVTAARAHLASLLGTSGDSEVRDVRAFSLTADEPDLQLVSNHQSPLTGTRVVVFDQLHQDIPVFGSHALVEMDAQGAMISANTEVSALSALETQPLLPADKARALLAEHLRVPPEELARVATPEACYFDAGLEKGCRLAWLFAEVPVAPAATREALSKAESDGHGMGPSPRMRLFSYDYVVDSEDGEVLFAYSRAPLATGDRDFTPPEISQVAFGTDDEGEQHELATRKAGARFELVDANRHITTLDLEGGDLDDPLPGSPATSDSPEWPDARAAAVSAHVNATRVIRFYRDVLARNGIDDNDMEVISVVNCTSRKDRSPVEWNNAIWYKGRMWYGRGRAKNKALFSYARYLEVVAHELTHGITERTSNLVYRNQSGALNESMSDILGVIIKNWWLRSKDDVSKWDWEIGKGLGKKGLPLRDLSAPSRTGDPDHFRDYGPMAEDEGGVHTFSNIHNKAAHLVLTTPGDDSSPRFTPEEVAVLYYLTLTRLDRMATFSKCLQVLLDVARVRYAIPAMRKKKLAALRDAYAAVGIEPKA